jgi:multiple sugar transport system ATP-binding protein
MAQVALDKITKAFGDTVAVSDVSFTAEAGEFLVLVGPSGCGKSTCLRMIAGLESATGGEIRIGDRRVNEVAPKDRDIGMVFQSYALYPHMTVRDNMAFGLKLRKAGKSEIETRVTEAAKMLDLEALLDRKPRALSGGQRQRVAIGRAICRQPEVFLFDEPLSNLDAAMRVAMRTELAELHGRLGATMIYVTHDQVEAMTLADRIAVLSAGELQQIGTPLELFEKPANRFVAGFIGSPAMNFARAERDGPRLRLLGAELEPPAIPDAESLTVGVRPQDVALSADGPFRGEVTLVELLGWEAYVHIECSSQTGALRPAIDLAGGAGKARRGQTTIDEPTCTVICRTDGRAAGELEVGDPVGFAIDAAKLHFFDPDGERLEP